MRIFLSYASATDKGEGRFYAEGLRQLGHQVHVVDVASTPPRMGWTGAVNQGFAAEVSFAELEPILGKPDLFLYVEPDGLIPRDINSAPCPTACVISDTHRRLGPRVKLARLFDWVFLYQRNYRHHFRDHPEGRVQWLPYGCDEVFFRPQHAERDLDLAFVGQSGPPGGERARGLAALSSRWTVNAQRRYTQSEMAGLYSRAKIVVNFPVGDDLNFRFFEALSCGALLLTKRIKSGQEDLFQEGTHFAAFADQSELLRQVEYYLTHDAERAALAAAGHAECLRSNTLRHRLEAILTAIGASAPGGAPVRAMSAPAAAEVLGSYLARAGRIEALLTLRRMPGWGEGFRKALWLAWLRAGKRMIAP